MMNANRCSRGLTPSPNCKVCLGLEETTLHVLRDCPRAEDNWIKLVPVNKQANFFTLPLKEWLSQNLRLATGKKDTWSTLFAITAWWI